MSTALQPLGPAGPPQTAADLVTRMGLWGDAGHKDRPRVVVAMIGSADGHATVDGRAGGLGSPADRSVLRELRTAADGLLVGSGTLIAERYATLLDPPQQETRVARGLPREPLLATISRRLDPRLSEIALFAEPEQRLLVYTEAEEDAASRGADVRTQHFAAGTLDARACLRHLRTEEGVRVLVSEGGPTLLRELVAERLVDDLVLTIAPALVAGDGRAVVHGPVFDPPRALALREVLRGEDHLFLHYVPAAEPA
jgi:riboflavin biosynthesis pyrimidine reductase